MSSLRWRKTTVPGNAWNETHALEILSITGRLRTHAQRALHEAGYITIGAESRRNHAENLRAMAKRIEDRQKLRLSAKWWFDLAKEIVDSCDLRNPT